MLRALRLCCFNRFGSVEYLWKAVWSDTARLRRSDSARKLKGTEN
jgi:hypothetical protein